MCCYAFTYSLRPGRNEREIHLTDAQSGPSTFSILERRRRLAVDMIRELRYISFFFLFFLSFPPLLDCLLISAKKMLGGYSGVEDDNLDFSSNYSLYIIFFFLILWLRCNYLYADRCIIIKIVTFFVLKIIQNVNHASVLLSPLVYLSAVIAERQKNGVWHKI